MTGMVEILCHIVEIITKKEIEVTGPEKAQFLNPIFLVIHQKLRFHLRFFCTFLKNAPMYIKPLL